jgi:adenine-specific DNA-methyltransferase
VITPHERDLLLAQLLEAMDRVANTSGHNNAYHKTWLKRALKKIRLEVPVIEFPGRPLGRAHQLKAEDLVRSLPEAELAYYDPPYNERQYSKLYHVYERRRVR